MCIGERIRSTHIVFPMGPPCGQTLPFEVPPSKRPPPTSLNVVLGRPPFVMITPKVVSSFSSAAPVARCRCCKGVNSDRWVAAVGNKTLLPPGAEN